MEFTDNDIATALLKLASKPVIKKKKQRKTILRELRAKNLTKARQIRLDQEAKRREISVRISERMKAAWAKRKARK
jgi:hypothetical protein